MTRTEHPGSNNLAARMGRWSAAHWKTATFGWLAFVLVAFGLGGLGGTKTIDDTKPGPGEAGRAQTILNEGFYQPAAESVLIQSDSVGTSDPAFEAAVRDVVAAVSRLGAVENVHRGAVSPDGHAALVDFNIRGDHNDAVDKIGPVIDRVAEVQQAHPNFFIGEFGDASAQDGFQTMYNEDLAKAGELSLPITLVILFIAFGALIAAGIPLLLGLTAVFGAFGLIAVLSHVIPMAQQAPALVLLIGLAVGVDYSMFYLRREREERAAGRSPEAALEVAAATSGRSVLISGVTVMAAMAGMFLTGDGTFASLAVSAILVVAIAVLGSLTVLPALLSRLGDKVDRPRIPLVSRLRRDDGQGRLWGGIVDRVMRRPAAAAALSAAFLVALALPALGLRMAMPSIDSIPKTLTMMQAYDRMQEAFPGAALPAYVVVKAPNVNAPAVREAIDGLKQRALASGRMHEPITVDVNRDATVAMITVPIDGSGSDLASKASLTALRDQVIPPTVGSLADAEVGVTGLTAAWQDQTSWFKSKLPFVFAFVLVLAFVLMLFAFRAPVIAAKAIVLNLLSVAAAYGLLVLVFQHGLGERLLGFPASDGIDPVVPLLLFVILFGLSMDYHVFILSRIREAVQRGVATEDAVAHGIRTTAGVVTSAAIVMVAVFSVFVALSYMFFKEFGIGLAAAILLDATIVRGVLLPASMKLLGDWNWWIPGWLQWLPRFDVDGEPVAPASSTKGVLA
jgi:uncharacterized membrane protein YdfJ with MMPL/SSD domain